jgi:glycosyltransferase involved in cell wall biosynthesis
MSDEYKVVVTKEYRKLSRDEPTIGLLMMVKNEKKRIGVTLKSIVGHVDALIIYDTGSTDNTKEIIQEFAEKHKINLYMIEGEFVNFSESRNVSLSYADTIDVKFVLLLDTNDELQGGDKLREFAKSHMNTKHTGYLTCQHWWSGQYDKYYNMRFVKNGCGWRYRGSVHEWMKDTTSETDQPRFPVFRMPDNIILYQDRTADDDKTGKRFKRDKKLLLADHKKDPKEPRTLFYLAQTCSCLAEYGEALYYYKLRAKLEGFQEEKFHAYLRGGDLCAKLGHDWHDVMTMYMKAAEHSNRAEPYVKIAHHYNIMKRWFLAYSFAAMACKLPYPEHCILFVDKRAYDYERWHILGIVAYYAGFYGDGKIACQKAIEQNVNIELDKANLEFYMKKEEEIKKAQEQKQQVLAPVTTTLTKKQFVAQTVAKILAENPRTKHSMATRKANMLWKIRNKS